MTLGAGATAFVTEAGGFLGGELTKLLVARGYHVIGLAGSAKAAQRIRRAGATAVMGDLLTPGQWQDEAASDCVFHLPAHSLNGSRVGRQRAAWIAAARVSMDRHLLDAIGAAATRRIVYVSDASCYGATMDRPVTEDAPLQPSGWGRCFTPALDRVEGYVAAGLPIVTVFPGWVYGNGSWFCERIIKPVTAGQRVIKFGKTAPWISPIHVHDCARALLHLAERGAPGGRYFVVNYDAIRLSAFAGAFACLANLSPRCWAVPGVATPLIAGPGVADHVRSGAVFSNIRLRGIGFRFEYPTPESGIQEVLGAMHE